MTFTLIHPHDLELNVVSVIPIPLLKCRNFLPWEEFLVVENAYSIYTTMSVTPRGAHQ